jgi:hypothetical protein
MLKSFKNYTVGLLAVAAVTGCRKDLNITPPKVQATTVDTLSAVVNTFRYIETDKFRFPDSVSSIKINAFKSDQDLLAEKMPGEELLTGKPDPNGAFIIDIIPQHDQKPYYSRATLGFIIGDFPADKYPTLTFQAAWTSGEFNKQEDIIGRYTPHIPDNSSWPDMRGAEKVDVIIHRENGADLIPDAKMIDAAGSTKEAKVKTLHYTIAIDKAGGKTNAVIGLWLAQQESTKASFDIFNAFTKNTIMQGKPSSFRADFKGAVASKNVYGLIK